MALSAAQLDGIFADIATLEQSRADNLETYLGSKQPNGAPRDGAGIMRAKKIQVLLNANPGGTGKWRTALDRVGKIVAG